MTNLSSLEIANAPTYLIAYPGSIVDISQLQYMLKKAEGYGYKKVGFILDRGYFGRENIQYMDECGYDFVIMVKGMSESVRRMILENKGEFENIRKYNIRKYKTFGKTIKKKLYISDEKERYFQKMGRFSSLSVPSAQKPDQKCGQCAPCGACVFFLYF